MESLNPEFALYGRTNKCARTDSVFFPISEVCTRGVTLATIAVTAMWLLCSCYVVAMWLLCGCFVVAIWLTYG